MTSLIFHVLSWPTIVIALLVWGFAPGALLRVIVLAFHRDDPRRHELLGELHAIPRIERPFWVVEQLEVALVEGLGQRLVWAATGRIIYRWHLGSGVRRNREHPDTFYLPPEEERQAVAPGMDVKLMFEMRNDGGERMWVTVTAVKKRKLIGRLSCLPVIIPRLMPGDKIKFKRDHIIDIWYDDDSQPIENEEQHSDHPGIQLQGQRQDRAGAGGGANPVRATRSPEPSSGDRHSFTKEPQPGTTVISPSSRSRASTLPAVVRAIPNSCMSAVTPGTRSPGRSSPERIRARMISATCRLGGTGDS